MPRPRCPVTDKVKYRTHDIALLALVDVVFDLEGKQPNRDPKAVPCRTYHCEFCAGWHLTSKPFDPNRAKRLTGLPQDVDSTQVSRDTDQRTGHQTHGTHR